QYAYDRRDQTKLTYPGGQQLNYVYDAAGRVQTVDDWRPSGPRQTVFTYDPAGRRTDQTLPNGTASHWSWDDANPLLTPDHKLTSGGTSFAKFDYTYDQAGNPTQQTNVVSGLANRTQKFCYDALHRLTGETPNGSTDPCSTNPSNVATYQYDAAGNLVSI